MNDTIKLGNTEFPTLLALTREEQERGLMFNKEWPPPVMSFVYGKAQINQFWMKNCFVDLDIVFVRNGKIISIFNGIQHSTALIGPNEPSDLVVELPFGTCSANNIKIGDAVILKCSNENAMKVFSKLNEY